MPLTEKQVILAVSGSIAAYKAVYLCRLLVDAGAVVWPVLTPGALRFVGPLSFSALSGRRAITDLWSMAEAGEVGHVELAHRAEALVVAPCTADTLARIAMGRADDPLTAAALSTRAPVLLAPAMETNMWDHPQTQGHIQTLQQRGARILWPEDGALASGRQGRGRMAEPEDILDAVIGCTTAPLLAGRRVLVTAGPTREHLCPARFISNPSTGTMGYALARAARHLGAEVTLISGPTDLKTPAGVRRVNVQTTVEMLNACEQHIASSQVLLMAAAPADYRPAQPSAHKKKKDDVASPPKLELAANPDILKTLNARAKRVFTVGFAAESQNLEQYARKKLADKNLDMIVANSISEPGAGFASQTNRVMLIHRDGTSEQFPMLSKAKLAQLLLQRIAESYQ